MELNQIPNVVTSTTDRNWTLFISKFPAIIVMKTVLITLLKGRYKRKS